MNGFLFLLCIPIIRALIAFNDWYFINTVCKKHDTYLKGQGKNKEQSKIDNANKASDWITANMTEIKRRIKKSGINEPVYSYMDPKGYGYVGQQSMSAIDNLLFLNQEIQNSAVTTLKRVKGYYSNQAKRSLSPLYWLEILLFLPKAMVNASGLDMTSKFADTSLKIVQLIYWLIVMGVIISKPELITALLSKVKI